MAKVDNPTVPHDEVDNHRRTAKAGMRLGARIRRSQTAEARNVCGQFENAPIVNVVQHATV